MPKYDLIEEDIKWCEEHRNSQEKVYQDGFIAGLKHALFLMKRHPAIHTSPIERDWGTTEEDAAWKYLQRVCTCSHDAYDDILNPGHCMNCRKPFRHKD